MRLIFVFFLMLHSSVTIAQNTGGNLEGRVVDSTGAAVIGANIVVTSNSLQGTRGTTSDNLGNFRLLYLPPGLYAVKIQHIAFKPHLIEIVRVGLGKTSELGEIRLKQKTLEMSEIIVIAERPLLDLASTTSGMNMVRQDFEALPIDRNYRSVAALLPHANASYLGDEVNIAGATGSENRYFIDGADVGDPFRGLTGTNLPYNFIREIQVKSGGYEPEYKSALGGIINAITFSGGDEFSGQLFGFFTNNNFSTQYRLAETEPPKGSYSQYDIGFVFGGPVLREKLWFSIAYSPSFRNEDIKIPGLGFYHDKTTVHPFAGKLTWKASKSLDFHATVVGDPTIEDAVGKNFYLVATVLNTLNPDLFLSRVSSGGYGTMIDGSYVLSHKACLQTNLSWKTRNDKYLPRTPAGKAFAYMDSETATASGGTGERVDVASSTLSANMDLTLEIGRHIIKTGMEYKQIGLDCYNTFDYLTRFDDSTYYSNSLRAIGSIGNRIPSAFIQDSWTLTDRFVLTGGMRWDGMYIVAYNRKIAQSILNQYQPRLGFAVTTGGKKQSKIFASVGRFADELLMMGSSIYHLGGAQIGLHWTHDPRIDYNHWDASDADTAWFFGGTIAPRIKNLHGQYYDEITIGYEHLFTSNFKFVGRGIYRILRDILEDSEAPAGSGQFYYANPGRPPLDEYPRASREYSAIELSIEASPNNSLNILMSYVLSRNSGNWAGMYWQDFNMATPNATTQFDYLDIVKNTYGLLPNDRTHVFKFNGSYRTPFGLSCGLSFVWESGTPLSDRGSSIHGSIWPLYLSPRGSVGRLPSLWDLNLRFAYNFLNQIKSNIKPRLILDVFHLGSQRTVVQQDQWHYLAQDDQGNQTNPSPTYGMPQKFQPPMSMRLGLEVNF